MGVIVTTVVDHHPGLTQSLAEAIQSAGGNWLESHFARLGGQYVGSVLVEIVADKTEALEKAVHQAGESGFKAGILPATGESEALAGQPLLFEIVCEDRPGIVREVATALAALEVNIEDLETSAEDSAMFGEKLFRAKAKVRVPEGVELDTVRDALEGISGDIMVDFENRG